MRVIFVIFWVTLSLSSWAKDYVRISSSGDVKEPYFVDLLSQALETTVAEYGEFEIELIPAHMSQLRTTQLIEQNTLLNLTWRMTSIDLEERLQAIYFPLLRGTMGYRIFIINKHDQVRFPENLTEKALKMLVAGQGYDWQDNVVLHHNGYSLLETGRLVLLDSLKQQKFDYYPRALHEAWAEIASLGSEFAVEKHLMLRYPAAVYFFVRKDNTRLASRLTKGLKQMSDTGRLKSFFEQHPITSNILQKSNLSKRKAFHLQNPHLSKATRDLLSDPQYWVDVD